MVEVTEGHGTASPRPPTGSGTSAARSACRAAPASPPSGPVRCHTMRRGHMRIEREAAGLPFVAAHVPRPGYGIAMDLGTTTIVLRLLDLETGELIADASFENPQRFGGSDVMARIHYDTEHPGKLLRRTLAGYLTHAIEELPVDPKTISRDGGGGQLHHARSLLPAERLLHRPEPLPVDHRNRNGRGQAHHHQPDRDRPPLSAAHSSEGARLRRAHHQRARGRRRRRLHAGRRPGARRPPGRHHGHRHQHRADRRQPPSHSGRILPRRPGIRRRRHRLRHAGAGWRHRRRAHR